MQELRLPEKCKQDFQVAQALPAKLWHNPKPATPPARTMLTLQIISVKWHTPESRPAEHAARRNSLPRVLPLPDAWLDASGFAVHTQAYTEHPRHSSRFEPEESRFQTFASLPEHFQSLHFCQESQALQIRLDDNGFYGEPPRRKRSLFTLLPGQTAQLRLNGRHARFYSDYHYYTQHTLNFAYRPKGDRRLFTSKPFAHSVSLEAVLF